MLAIVRTTHSGRICEGRATTYDRKNGNERVGEEQLQGGSDEDCGVNKHHPSGLRLV